MAADNGEPGLTLTKTQEMMTSQRGVTPPALPSPLPSAWLLPGAAEDMATEDAACHPKAASILCPSHPAGQNRSALGPWQGRAARVCQLAAIAHTTGRHVCF